MNTNETWKPVTISGVTGILMGAGIVYGVKMLASTGEETVSSAEGEMKVVSSDDSISFKHAFDAARAELGPGGVFTWRGNIYNTYTVDEWQSMSDDERNLFVSRIKSEISPTDAKDMAEDVSIVETEVDTDDVDVAEVVNAADDVAEVVPEEVTEEKAEVVSTTEEITASSANVSSWDDLVDDDNDVRIIGYEDVEISNGQTVTIQGLEVNGQRVAVIDVDKDGVADIAMSDLNHNFQMDEGEVIDLHTGEAVSFANDDYAAHTNDSEVFDGVII